MPSIFFPEIILLTLLLATQLKLASGLPPASRTLVSLQVFYWLVSYVVGGIYLWSAQPGPHSPLYDSRLATIGYQLVLPHLFYDICAGQLGYCFLLALWRLRKRKLPAGDSGNLPASVNPGRSWTLFALLALSWIGRLGEVTGIGATKTIWGLGEFVPALAVLIMPLTRARQRWTYSAILLAEVVWTLVTASKTPIISIALALIIRRIISRKGKNYFKDLPWGVASFLATFAVVQPLKGINTATSISSQGGNSYIGGVLVSVLQRINILNPVADAYFFPLRPWLSAPQYWKSLWTGFLPTGIHENIGVRWTREVKSASFLYQYRDVSIAPGGIGEGLAERGALGAFLEMFFIALITVAVGSALHSRSLPVVVLASTFAFNASLYEGGILSISQAGSIAIRAALIAKAVSLLLGKCPPAIPIGRYSGNEVIPAGDQPRGRLRWVTR